MVGITRVLIANRGEIAVRIVRACRELGIETVVAVSEADRDSLPARLADHAVCVGPPRARDSYLNLAALVVAALGTRSMAIHPGYGFLAEQPELAEACRKHGIVFIGPSPNNLRDMGNKLLARQMVAAMGIPIISGSQKVKDAREAVAASEKVGFPILLKASAGGGGRGIVIVKEPRDLKTVFEMMSAEVQAAFGDGTLFVEKYIPNARHVEIQILADLFGNVLHLGERDCSIQRRYQKMIEEAPSPVVSSGLREEMAQCAVTIARNIHYENLGTVEFLLDQDKGKFYFLEMNTRIQVEHPVTEAISGVDLVQEQIRIAAREPLSLSQKQVRLSGHAIECRINAENPSQGFRPCPGLIKTWEPPKDRKVRVDSHCYSGYTVPPYYDSLLAKLITSGDSRLEAIDHMVDALRNYTVLGVDTTIPFLLSVVKHPDFVEGNIYTRWLEDVIVQKDSEP